MGNDYSVPFNWRKYVSPSRDGHNRPVDAWPDSGILWGSLEGLSSSEGEEHGGDRSRISATIRLNQMPAITVQDHFVDTRYGETWICESFYRDHDANEMIVTAFREIGRYD